GDRRAQQHSPARFDVLWITQDSRQTWNGQFERFVREHQGKTVALFCDRGFDRVSDRVNASVGGDQQRLRNRERGIQNGDTGGGLGIEARHFLVRLLVGNERGGLAFTAGSGGRRNRDQRQHRLGRP